MSKAPVALQYGHVKLYVNDVSALGTTISTLMSMLPAAAQAHPESLHSADPELFAFIGQSANKVLSALSLCFHLKGKAAKNLGTALRVAAVRAALGTDLLQELSYLASAADALRHLTVTSIKKASAELRTICAKLPNDDVLAHSVSPGVSPDLSIHGDEPDVHHHRDPAPLAQPHQSISTLAWDSEALVDTGTPPRPEGEDVPEEYLLTPCVSEDDLSALILGPDSASLAQSAPLDPDPHFDAPRVHADALCVGERASCAEDSEDYHWHLSSSQRFAPQVEVSVGDSHAAHCADEGVLETTLHTALVLERSVSPKRYSTLRNMIALERLYIMENHLRFHSTPSTWCMSAEQSAAVFSIFQDPVSSDQPQPAPGRPEATSANQANVACSPTRTQKLQKQKKQKTAHAIAAPRR